MKKNQSFRPTTEMDERSLIGRTMGMTFQQMDRRSKRITRPDTRLIDSRWRLGRGSNALGRGIMGQGRGGCVAGQGH